MFPLAVIAVIAGNLDLHFLSHESFPLAGSGCWPGLCIVAILFLLFLSQ